MLPAEHTTPISDTQTPTFWLDTIPSDLQHRIAQYVCDGKSGLDALNLAKASRYQRRAVCTALDYTLHGSFATHAHDLVSHWVDVFDDVCVLELREHPPNFKLLSSPSLRVLMIEDEPLQLEALANSNVSLDRLDLTIRFHTPSYLVCRFLAKVNFKAFVLQDINVVFLQNLDPAELVAACQGVENVVFDDHCWIHTGVAEFVTNLPSLRELYIDIQGCDTLDEMLPVMEKLERVRIAGWQSQICQLVQFTTTTQTQLKELCLMSLDGWGCEQVREFREVIGAVSDLEKLTVKLLNGAERFFPQMPFLKKLEISWLEDDTIIDEDDYLYKPTIGTVVEMIEGLPSLTALRMFNIKLSDAEVIAVVEMLGSGLKEFGMSIHGQGVSLEQKLLTIIKSLTIHANHLTELELRHYWHYTILYRERVLTWDIKQEILLRLDRLRRKNPALDLKSVEDLILRWPHEDENDNSDDDDAKKEARRKTLALRRCRRGMNEEGGVSHMVALAGLLETGCDGLEQDLDSAVDLYKQAVRMGDYGDAIMKLWELTETTSPESPKRMAGGALDLILEMDRRKLKTLPHFADVFYYGTRTISPNNHAAERILQLAVDKGYITPCAMKLATLVEKGYADVPPDPGRAVDLYQYLANHCDDIDALFWLADWLNEGYGDKPSNPAEARVYLERGTEKRCCHCMNFLALLVQEGYEGVKSNPEEAIALFQKAIDHGSKIAKVNLGSLYSEGYAGHPPNPYKAIELFEEAIAEDRNPVALRHLGNLIEMGYDDHDPDPKRAVELYQESVDQGDKRACTCLANLVAYGFEDIPPDPDRAIRLYEQAIDSGNKGVRAAALRNYGDLLLQGSGDLKPNPTGAAEYFGKAIDQGDGRALRALGDLLRNGDGSISPNPVEACKLYQRAIDEENDPTAMRKLARLLKHGCGDVKPDPVRAVELYRRAIDAGSVSSCASLAGMFQEGYDKVPQDLMQAAELYKKGVDAGDPEAMCRLGVMLEEGFCSVYANPLAGIELYNRAIDEHNYGKAMRYLGRTLEDGYLDKQPDPEAAKALFERGVAANDPWSKVCLATLLEDGYPGVDPDVEKARLLYNEIITDDDCDERISIAMRRLGHIIENAAEDDATQLVAAAEWYLKSLNKNESCLSLFRLAVLMSKGFEGRDPNACAVVSLLRRAIEYESHAEPFFVLASMIEEGYADVEPDAGEAEELAERGFVVLSASLELNSTT